MTFETRKIISEFFHCYKSIVFPSELTILKDSFDFSGWTWNLNLEGIQVQTHKNLAVTTYIIHIQTSCSWTKFCLQSEWAGWADQHRIDITIVLGNNCEPTKFDKGNFPLYKLVVRSRQFKQNFHFEIESRNKNNK